MLSEPQLSRFREQGFLVVEDVIGPDVREGVVDEYGALMDRLYEGWYADGLVSVPPDGLSFWDKLTQCYKGGFDWFQPFDISLPHDGITDETPMHFGPAVFDMVTHPRLLDMVEQLIGPEITSNPIQHVRIKPPLRALPEGETRAHITTTDWHQDLGVTMPEADNTEFVTVWLAITDATVENGCLQVAPGSANAMLPHCARTQLGISEQFLPKKEAVPAPVKAGGAVIFHPLTPHSSLPNRSDGFRWSFDLRYNVTGQPSGRSQFPDFVARSRSNPETELRDWRAWREMWEDTRHHLAHVEHMPQHRWPADGPYCA